MPVLSATPAAIPRTLAFLVIAALACDDPTSPRDVEGTWGATEARLTITPVLAEFESPCWSGMLSMPFDFGDDGRFTAAGLLTYQGSTAPPQGMTVFASYKGRVRGDRLSLVVGPATLGLGPYEMQRDQAVSIPACS